MDERYRSKPIMASGGYLLLVVYGELGRDANAFQIKGKVPQV